MQANAHHLLTLHTSTPFFINFGLDHVRVILHRLSVMHVHVDDRTHDGQQQEERQPDFPTWRISATFLAEIFHELGEFPARSRHVTANRSFGLGESASFRIAAVLVLQ